MRYADGRRATRPVVSNVWLQLLGRDGVFSAVIEPDREDALIGAIVLEELDLLVVGWASPTGIQGISQLRPYHMVGAAHPTRKLQPLDLQLLPNPCRCFRQQGQPPPQ